MGFFDRVGKVITSNVNTLLDKAEDPRKTVDLLIVEMREQLRKGRQDVVGAVAAEKQLRQKVQELDVQIDKWQRRAELAVRANDEKLAREALVFKKKLAEDRDKTEATRAEQRGRALQMKEELGRGEIKLRELEARKGTIAVRYQQARAGGGTEALGATGTGPTPFDELRRVEGNLEQSELEAQGMREAQDAIEGKPRGAMSAAELEARFAELEGSDGDTPAKASASEVDDELKAIRRKLRVAP